MEFRPHADHSVNSSSYVTASQANRPSSLPALGANTMVTERRLATCNCLVFCPLRFWFCSGGHQWAYKSSVRWLSCPMLGPEGLARVIVRAVNIDFILTAMGKLRRRQHTHLDTSALFDSCRQGHVVLD